jgi:hypothetical protein
MAELLDDLTRWVFFLALLYCAYAYALKPQVWHLFQIGWKRLNKRFAAPPQLLSSSLSLVRVGWNQYQAAVQTTATGVYVQQQSPNDSARCLLIPYEVFKVGQPGGAFKLLTADAYDFFTVDGIQVWVQKEYGRVILTRISA